MHHTECIIKVKYINKVNVMHNIANDNNSAPTARSVQHLFAQGNTSVCICIIARPKFKPPPHTQTDRHVLTQPGPHIQYICTDKPPPPHTHTQMHSYIKTYSSDLKFRTFNLHLNDLFSIFQFSGEIFSSILINN